MSARPQLPDVLFPPPDPNTGGTASRDALYSAARASQPASGDNVQQMRLVPDGTTIRVILGEHRVGALLRNALVHDGKFLMMCLWCWNRDGNEGVQSVTMDDQPLPASVEVTHYDGSANPIDPWFLAAFAAIGVTYPDDLAGWCWSAVRMPASLAGQGALPQIAAVVRGPRAFDQRSGLTVFTDNASLLTARWIEDPDWGMGMAVDHSTLPACADANDELLGGEPRRRMSLVLERDVPVKDMLAALRTYAGVFVLEGENGARFVPDRPIASFTAIGDGTAIPLRAITETRKSDPEATPTLLRVWYTDRSQIPWRQRYAEVADPLLAGGGVPYRDQDVRLPGIPDYAQAHREGRERLNKLRLADLSVDYGLFNEGIAIEPGDGVQLTSAAAALAGKLLRVFSRSGGLGDYDFTAAEYDPLMYSDEVASAPTFGDSALSSPNEPTPPASMTIVEENYQRDDGETDTRLRITWPAPVDFPWVAEYIVNVLEPGGAIPWSGRPRSDDREFLTGALREGTTYQIDIRTVSASGAVSAPVSDAITAQGDQLDPGNVSSLTGVAARGEVHLAVGPAIDKNMAGYSLRYVAVGGSWAAAKEFAFEGARSGVGAYVRSKLVPVGTWDILAAALDTRDRYSPVPARLTITVPKADSSSFLNGELLDAPTLTLMSEEQPVSWGPKHWVSDAGDPLGYGHADPDDSTGTFDDLATTAAIVPRSGGDSIWLSEVYDPAGIEVAGDWVATVSVTDIDGTHSVAILTSLDGVAWTTNPGTTVKASARYARLEIRTAGVMRVDEGARLDVIAQASRESIAITSNASAGVVVDLDGEYVKLTGISLAIEGGGAGRSWEYQIVQLGIGVTNQIRIFIIDTNTGQLAVNNALLDVEGV